MSHTPLLESLASKQASKVFRMPCATLAAQTLAKLINRGHACNPTSRMNSRITSVERRQEGPLCACLLRMGHVRVLCAIVAIAGYPHGRRLADRQLIELHEKADVPSTSIPAAGAPSIANFIHDTNTEQRAPQQGVSSAAVDVPPAAEPAFHFHYHDDDRSSRWNLPPPTPAP